MRAACAVGNRGVRQRIEDFHRHAEVDAQDFRRVFHERLLRFGEIADGLDVKCGALGSRAVWAGGEVLIKRLPVLGMLREPVAGGGPRFLLHERLEPRGVRAQSLERWRFLCGRGGDEEGDDERGEPVFHGGNLARRPAGTRGFVVSRRKKCDWCGKYSSSWREQSWIGWESLSWYIFADVFAFPGGVWAILTGRSISNQPTARTYHGQSLRNRRNERKQSDRST